MLGGLFSSSTSPGDSQPWKFRDSWELREAVKVTVTLFRSKFPNRVIPSFYNGA